ncbi:hypothetical protein KTD19_27865 [Burkholderia multivorans]|uniref:hypothetical protein n=1 Tax=Burkholderia multivorans TaxID=87883 RepID=UPI001C240D3F|nr:hypothetical protein [Burkholderia multivorans]MBU9236196.1 hypothetical protein [Burkholderia multivorans]
MAANQAASSAIQANTDQSGNVNVPQVLAALSQNPASAYNLPDVAAKLYGMEGAKYSAQNAKLEGIQKQIGYWGSQLGGLVAKGDNVTQQDVISALTGGVQNGMISPQQAIQYAQELPQDPKELSGWAKNHWVSLQNAKDQVALLAPQGGIVNTGGQQFFTNRDPLTGKVQLVGGVTNTLSPEAAAQNVDVVDPNTGAHYAITKQQQLQGMGNGGVTAGQGYTGRYNAPGQAGSFAGGIQTSLGPGQQAALAAQAGTSNTAAQTLHDAAADAPMRINLLENARDALSGIQTGPGTDWRNQAKSFFNALAPDIAKKVGWTGDVQNYDEFKKILTNYASSVSGSLGTGTDARLNAAVTGNANPNISKLANEDILAKTVAAEKMRAAQDYAFQNSGLTTDKFNQWQSQWNKTVNPDAFVFTSMNPAQQQAFLKRQSPQQLSKLKADLGSLVRAGLIQMPGGQ